MFIYFICDISFTLFNTCTINILGRRCNINTVPFSTVPRNIKKRLLIKNCNVYNLPDKQRYKYQLDAEKLSQKIVQNKICSRLRDRNLNYDQVIA